MNSGGATLYVPYLSMGPRKAVKLIVILSVWLLSAACVETTNETPGTFTTRGEIFETTTRQFQRPGGRTCSRMINHVGAERVSCIPGDRADCETALFDIYTRNRGGF